MAEWLGRALQKLPQRFESARDLLNKDYINVVLIFLSYIILIVNRMKYTQIIGLLAALALIFICFIPWVYVPSLQIYLSGINGKGSPELNFGSQVKSHGFLALLMGVCFLVPRVWAKRLNVFLGAINLSWAFKNFLIFSMCRAGECPEKQMGLYLLLIVSAILLVASLFPKLELKK